MKMLLAIDIGNTNITFGIFKGKHIERKFNIPTQTYALNKLKNKLAKLKPLDAVICSVVPKKTAVLLGDLKKILPGRVFIIGKNLIVPIKNLYRNPKQVGQDRLVNAFAGVTLYGSPLIVVDFGTAVTFDIISKDKAYLGGMILPGLRISLEALNKRTALLPRIILKAPKEFIGKDTKTSMLSGIVYGFGCLTDDLIMRIKKETGRNTLVVGTGGNIDLISKYCTSINAKDINLTLKGLYLIYIKNT